MPVMLRHNQSLFMLHLKYQEQAAANLMRISFFLTFNLASSQSPLSKQHKKSLLTHRVRMKNYHTHIDCLPFTSHQASCHFCISSSTKSIPDNFMASDHFSMSGIEQLSAKLKAGMKGFWSYLGCCWGCWRSLTRWRYSSLRLCRYLSCSLR